MTGNIFKRNMPSHAKYPEIVKYIQQSTRSVQTSQLFSKQIMLIFNIPAAFLEGFFIQGCEDKAVNLAGFK